MKVTALVKAAVWGCAVSLFSLVSYGVDNTTTTESTVKTEVAAEEHQDAQATVVTQEQVVVTPTTAKSEEKKKVVLTGSHIPQEVKRAGRNVTSSNVRIIDQKEIHRSGGQTVTEVLTRDPAIFLKHRR